MKLYHQFKLDEPWDSEHNKKLSEQMPAVYASPGVKAGMTRLQVFAGKAAAFEPGKNQKGAKLYDMTDATSNTIMVALAAEPVEGTKPADKPFDPPGDPCKLLHFVDHVTPLSFADGSAINGWDGSDVKDWRNAMTRDDGQLPGSLTKPAQK